MADEQRNASGDNTETDRGDLTPPHGDELAQAIAADESRGASPAPEELKSEATFGRTDRYANQDDPEAERPVIEEVTLVSDEELHADARQRRMEDIDNAAADDARMAVRKRERRAE